MIPASLTAIALQEELDAYLFYEKQSEGLGDRFLSEVENALNQVSLNPTHYTYSDATNTLRDVALEHFPYIIIFQVFNDNIVVYNIYHTKRKP